MLRSGANNVMIYYHNIITTTHGIAYSKLINEYNDYVIQLRKSLHHTIHHKDIATKSDQKSEDCNNKRSAKNCVIFAYVLLLTVCNVATR